MVEKTLKELSLNERQIKAIEYLKECNKITNGEYQRINGCARNTASRDLTELVKMELIIPSNQKGVGSYYSLK